MQRNRKRREGTCGAGTWEGCGLLLTDSVTQVISVGRKRTEMHRKCAEMFLGERSPNGQRVNHNETKPGEILVRCGNWERRIGVAQR